MCVPTALGVRLIVVVVYLHFSAAFVICMAAAVAVVPHLLCLLNRRACHLAVIDVLDYET